MRKRYFNDKEKKRRKEMQREKKNTQKSEINMNKIRFSRRIYVKVNSHKDPIRSNRTNGLHSLPCSMLTHNELTPCARRTRYLVTHNDANNLWEPFPLERTISQHQNCNRRTLICSLFARMTTTTTAGGGHFHSWYWNMVTHDEKDESIRKVFTLLVVCLYATK